MSNGNLFQDRKTGKLVEFMNVHDKDFAMVKDAAGNISYVDLEQLVPYDRDKGRLSKIELKAPEPPAEEEVPASVVPLEDTRLNLNVAPAEIIAKRLPGLGFATAKKIVEVNNRNTIFINSLKFHKFLISFSIFEKIFLKQV